MKKLFLLCLIITILPLHGTVYGEEEIRSLLSDTDALVKEYKETHEGWL